VALAVALATFTGADNTHTAPEYSGGGDGKNWPHVVAHLVIAAVILPLGTATRKARAAFTGTCRGSACTRPAPLVFLRLTDPAADVAQRFDGPRPSAIDHACRPTGHLRVSQRVALRSTVTI